MKIGGLKLSFGDDEDPKVIAGKKEIRHRNDLIREKLAEKDIHALDLIFFNFKTPDVRNESTIEEIKEEEQLFSEYADLLLRIASVEVPEDKLDQFNCLKRSYESFYKIEQNFNGCKYFGITEDNAGDFHEPDSYCN